VNKVIRQVCERFEPVAREKGLTVQQAGLDKELMVKGDREELDRIFSNLISNAVKYTQAGGVEVVVEGTEGWVRITVSDTGIGIPADELPQLFQEFFRASNAKVSQETGTGLGLAIVKDIVGRSGGRIEVISKEGVGTSFVVLLPALSD
jgi:signal transduction histidine kinase